MKSDGPETDNLNKGTEPLRQTQSVSTQAGVSESVSATSEPQSLLLRVLERDNIQLALKRIHERNEAPGIDGMTADELPNYLKEHWSSLRSKLATVAYRPQPMMRVELPSADGKIRLLGIPTMVDRFVQQAIVQVIQAQWEANREIFQPQHSVNRIVREIDVLLKKGDRWVFPPKIERFFDKTPYDQLITRLGRRLPDRNLLRLINRFVKMYRRIYGDSEQVTSGVPRLGPLTQILALVVLEQLEKEFNRRSARRAAEQYAKSSILVKSKRVASQALQSLTSWISKLAQTKGRQERTDAAESIFSGQDPDAASAPKLLKDPLPWLKAYFGIGEASHHRSYLDVTMVISLLVHAALLLIQFGVPDVNLTNFVAVMENTSEPRQEIRVQLAKIDPEPPKPPVIEPPKNPEQIKLRKDLKQPRPLLDKTPDPRAPLSPSVQVDDLIEPAGDGPKPVPGRPTMKTKVLTMVDENASDFMLPPLEVRDSRRPAQSQVLQQARELDAKNKADLIAKQKAALALRLEEKRKRAEEKAKRLAQELEAKQQAKLLAQQKAEELALLKLQQEEERKQLALKKQAEEAEKRELEAAQLKEKQKLQEEEDRKRLALEQEAQKQAELIAQEKAAEQARLKALQEEEQKQQALKKQAEDEAKRLAQEAARLKEQQRLQEELAKRQAAELEAKKQAELIAQQKAAELARLKAQQEEEQKQQALKKQAEEEARRLAQEAARLKEQQRLQEELAKRQAAELEAKKQAELIAQQKAAEQARLKAQQEEEQRQQALKKQAEEEARRLAQEAARLKEKQRQEEELAKRLAAELEAKKQAELIAQQKAAELARLKAQQEEEQRQQALKKQAEEAARREQELARLKEKQRQEEELAKRLAQEAEAKRLAQEAEAKRLAQEAEAKRQAELLAQQKAAELARKKLEQEQAERQARLAEEQRLAQQEKDRQLALKIAAQKLAEEAARVAREAAIQLENKRLEEERAKRQREEDARRAEAERLRKLEEDRLRRLQEAERLRREAEERARRKQEELERQMEADRLRRLQQQKEAEEANLKYLKNNQGKGAWVY